MVNSIDDIPDEVLKRVYGILTGRLIKECAENGHKNPNIISVDPFANRVTLLCRHCGEIYKERPSGEMYQSMQEGLKRMYRWRADR